MRVYTMSSQGILVRNGEITLGDPEWGQCSILVLDVPTEGEINIFYADVSMDTEGKPILRALAEQVGNDDHVILRLTPTGLSSFTVRYRLPAGSKMLGSVLEDSGVFDAQEILAMIPVNSEVVYWTIHGGWHTSTYARIRILLGGTVIHEKF